MTRVKDIASRCLALGDMLATDTLPTGTTGWIADAVMGAIGEMRRKAPGRFGMPLGDTLRAPATLNVTVDSTEPGSITLGDETTVPNGFCTLRITGMSSDATIFGIQGTAGSIAPGYDGTSGTVEATVYHDAWRIADGGAAVVEEGMTVKIAGEELERVGSREHAERMCGWQSTGRRQVTTGTGKPACWWLERLRGEAFLCVYPMPGAVQSIETRVVVGAQEVSGDNVLTCSENFDLPDDVAREIWQPLAIRRYMASPLFANVKIPPEVTRQAQEAEQALDRMRPKRPAMPAWNRGMPPVDRYPLRPAHRSRY